MSDPAFTLAAIRANGTQQLAESDRCAAASVASRLGRRLVEVDDLGCRAFTLSWEAGYEPPTQDDAITVERLSPAPLLTLAVCLGLCWTDPASHPYPGESTAVDDVLDVVAGLGADRASAVYSLRSALPLARLIQRRRRQVMLGPAVAAWPSSQVDGLRRFADLLPRQAGAEGAR